MLFGSVGRTSSRSRRRSSHPRVHCRGTTLTQGERDDGGETRDGRAPSDTRALRLRGTRRKLNRRTSSTSETDNATAAQTGWTVSPAPGRRSQHRPRKCRPHASRPGTRARGGYRGQAAGRGSGRNRMAGCTHPAGRPRPPGRRADLHRDGEREPILVTERRTGDLWRRGNPAAGASRRRPSGRSALARRWSGAASPARVLVLHGSERAASARPRMCSSASSGSSSTSGIRARSQGRKGGYRRLSW